MTSLQPPPSLRLGQGGLQTPRSCTAAVVGGAELARLGEVSRVLAAVAEDTLSVAEAVFLVAEEQEEDINLNLTSRNRYSPAMVNNKHNITVKEASV